MAEKPTRRRKAPARKGGRPPYRPTIEARQTVEQMKFCGESDNTIARALGIDPDTLRKHFVDELADGHAQRRKEVVELLFTAARTGNVSAIKKLEEMGRVAGAAAAIEHRAAPKTPKLGKKEQAAATAAQVEGKFAPPPAPKLVVNNS